MSGTTGEALAFQHRDELCRDAEALISTLDCTEFGKGRTFHVMGFHDLGIPSEKPVYGFTICHFHELAADYLPRRRSSKPASAVAVNVGAVGRNLTVPKGSDVGATVRRLRSGVAAVAAHEYAHNVVATLKGKTLPEGFTLRQLIESLDDSAVKPGHRRSIHCEQWLRAFIHLAARASSSSCHPDEWQRSLRRDVLAAGLGEVSGFIKPLQEELARFDFTNGLADILRTPAPTGFLEIYQQRDSQRLVPKGGS